MRVLILSRAILCHGAGGLERYTELLAYGLSKINNFEVHILTTRHPDGVPELIKDNIHTHFLPKGKPGKYNFETFRLFACLAQNIDKKLKFDVIHSQGFAGCLLIKKKGQKIIVSPHGTIFSETPLYKDYFSILSASQKIKVLWKNKNRLFFLPAYKRLLSIADYIHSDSEFIKQNIMQSYPKLKNKIKVIPLGLPENLSPKIDKEYARKKLNISTEYPLFFAIGRHAPLKGFDVIINAAKKIASKNFDLWIGGTGVMTEKYKKLVRDLGLDNVKFIGRVPEEELPYYYAAADFTIVPDILCPAFGLTALESLMQNTKVIASDSGALPEIIKADQSVSSANESKFGFIFEKNNPEDLANIMQYAIDKVNKAKEKGSEFIASSIQRDIRTQIIEKFSFEKMIDRISNLYFSSSLDNE